MALAEKKCAPCASNMTALPAEEAQKLHAELQGWQLKEKRISKSFKFDNFEDAMKLAQKIAVVAEQEGHHPDLHIRWGELSVEVWTHKIGALTENDFILAAKIDRCASES